MYFEKFFVYLGQKDAGQRIDAALHRKRGAILDIYYYTKIHGRSPSESEMQTYFGVTPPAVHQMVVSLEKKV